MARTVKYSSYATHLERRVIMQAWNSTWRRQGRMVFRSITRENDTHWADIIGYEMVTGVEGYRWRQDRNASRTTEQWIFRTYLDGVAYYRKDYFRNLINRYPTTHDVDEVVAKHFYVDTEIPDGDCSYSKIQVLRRKPLSDYSRQVALKEINLGDYLVRKFNMGDAHATI